MKIILLTGGASLLGKALVSSIPPGWQIILAEHRLHDVFPPKPNITTVALDITGLKQIDSIIQKYQPDIVIHAAALSNVDYCEDHRKKAFSVNVNGTSNIVEACEKPGIPIIFISSNAVFDGHKSSYNEKDIPHPINFYGQTKYEGEKIIKHSHVPWKIVRLMTMYGWPPKGARDNPVTWALDKLKKGETLKIVNDIYLNPLYHYDAAKAIWLILTKGQPANIYHVAGRDIINRFEWMVETAKIFNYPLKLIVSVSNSYFNGKIAPRPPQTIYSLNKIKKELGFYPLGIKAGLEAMRREKDGSLS